MEPIADSVRAARPALQRAFADYESSGSTPAALERFCAAVRGAGLSDGLAVRRALQSTPALFSSVLRALSREEEPAARAAAAVPAASIHAPQPPAFPRPGGDSATARVGGYAWAAPDAYAPRGAGAGAGAGARGAGGGAVPPAAAPYSTALRGEALKSYDPILDTGVRGFNEPTAMRLDRAAAVGPWHTATQSDATRLRGDARASGKAHENRADMHAESGAGAVIFGGAVPPGATYEQTELNEAYDKVRDVLTPPPPAAAARRRRSPQRAPSPSSFLHTAPVQDGPRRARRRRRAE